MALTHAERSADEAGSDAPAERRVATGPSDSAGGRSRPTLAPRRTNGQELLIVAGCIAVTVLLVVAAGIVWVQRQIDNITADVDGLTAAATANQTNWLIVGSDSREGLDAEDPDNRVFTGEEVIGRRTDTIIVARLDADSRTVDLLSLPRDLWVPIHGTARDGRINSAFNGEGGQQRLIDTVEDALDIDIHHYAEINFVGFQEAVDAMDGIPVWFDRALRDPAAGLMIDTPGCQVLDGWDALAFARSRTLEFYDGQAWRADGSGDLGRATRQKFLIQRMVDHATASLDITDINTVVRLISAAGSNLTIDSGITPDRLVELATIFDGVEGDEISTHVLPTVPFRTPGGAAVLAMQPAEAQRVLAIFRGEEPEPIEESEAAVRISIYNGSRTPGQAGEVEGLLGAQGFEIDLIDNGPTTADTLITYGPGMETGAERVARFLVVAPTFVPDETAKGIALTTGTDFEGIRETPLSVDAVAAPEVPAPAGAPPVVTAAATPAVAVGVVPGPPPPGRTCS